MKKHTRKPVKRTSYLLFTAVIVLCAVGAHAENIDPDSSGCKYAWGENVGWINFKPTQGPGVTVTGTAVTGMAWGENIGWINLNPASGGMVNDGLGHLSGYAWGENVGWINFAPAGGGVTIGSDGKFTGFAWGENIGWINFSASNTCVKTAWIPVVPGTGVIVTPNAQVTLSFDNVITGGTVTATPVAPGDVPPQPYYEILPGSAFNITTNAIYTGQIKVCIGYNLPLPEGVNETELKLFHYVNGSPVDITDPPVDTNNKKVCGLTDSLSLYAIAARSYDFTGFFNPINNLPTVNNAKAGQSIPVIWRLTDMNGVPISDPASFRSVTSSWINCSAFSGDPVDPIEEHAAGASGLQYQGDGIWQFNWKTSKSYAGQCRRMVLILKDGSTHEADFKFSR
jgi:hypothetical protein